MSITAQVRTALNKDPRSFYAIAKLAKVHVSTVTRFAGGEGPNARVLDAVAEVLDLTVVKKEQAR